jgi:DNA-binding FadR family transcriptional regulator
VSRPTLREAFRILEAESLLTVRGGARGGAQVVTPDLSVAARHVGSLPQVSGTTIGEVYGARLAIEPTAARTLALRRRGTGTAPKHWRTHLQVAYKTLFGAEAAAGVLDLYEKPARA